MHEASWYSTDNVNQAPLQNRSCSIFPYFLEIVFKQKARLSFNLETEEGQKRISETAAEQKEGEDMSPKPQCEETDL